MESLPEKRIGPGEHAEEDDARGPQVDRGVLLGALEQHLGRAEAGRAGAGRLLVRALLAAPIERELGYFFTGRYGGPV